MESPRNHQAGWMANHASTRSPEAGTISTRRSQCLRAVSTNHLAITCGRLPEGCWLGHCKDAAPVEMARADGFGGQPERSCPSLELAVVMRAMPWTRVDGEGEIGCAKVTSEP